MAIGGILQPIQRDAEVECLPGIFPSSCQVDVTGLDVHDAIRVSQLQPRQASPWSTTPMRQPVTVLPADRGRGEGGGGGTGRGAAAEVRPGTEAAKPERKRRRAA